MEVMYSPRGGYRHFKSLLTAFYKNHVNYTVSSINNHALNMASFENDVRISRFIRDPRDLLVSGYFYHKRGAESWCNIVNPTDKDWEIVNGVVPKRLPKGLSFSAYLSESTLEEGLLTEIEFRQNHFISMIAWPQNDPRIKLFRYEDILGNEDDVFAQIFSFYGLPPEVISAGVRLAVTMSAGKSLANAGHIRNPIVGQWREYFTTKASMLFEEKFGAVLRAYGYA
jgi:hypothetical protein